MTPAKALVSAFIVLICSLKVSEIAFQIESFPLTYTGVFQDYEPPEKIPWTYRVEGFRGRRWREIHPWILNLSPGAMRAKLGADRDELAERCGRLGDTLNARRPRKLRMQRMRVHAHGHARPGRAQADQLVTLECPLDQATLEKP